LGQAPVVNSTGAADGDISKNEAMMPKQNPELIRLPQETLILCVVSALDVIMTYYLLTREDLQFTESNPVARYFLEHWGMRGMVYFKATMTIFVCVITQIVARRNLARARQVLGVATVIVVGVVVYSVWLHFQHRQIIQVIEP
jgi:hypothetical protein